MDGHNFNVLVVIQLKVQDGLKSAQKPLGLNKFEACLLLKHKQI